MAKLIEAVSKRALTVAGWGYLIITALICFDVVARRFLGFSSGATTEWTGYLMAISMTWGLAGTLYERGHVRIDVLVQKMPLRVRVWLHLLSLLALLVASGFFAWGAVSVAMDSWTFGSEDLSALHTPLVIPQGLWAAGLALFLLSVVALAMRAVHQLATGRRDEMDAMLMARTYVDEAAETLEAIAETQPAATGAAKSTKLA